MTLPPPVTVLTINRLLNRLPELPPLPTPVPPLLLVELTEEAKEHGDEHGVEITLCVPTAGPPRWVVFLPWISAEPVQIPLGAEGPVPAAAPPKGGLLVYEVGSDRVMRALHLEGEFFFIAADEVPTAPPKGDLEHDPWAAAADEDTQMWIMDRHGNMSGKGTGSTLAKSISLTVPEL